MVYKKTSKRVPKPNRAYYAPSQGAMRRMQDALTRYDEVVSAKEREWGVDRLPWLAGEALRAKFDAQMDLLNAAIDKMEDVEHQVEVTLRGVAALERAAIEAGYKPLTGEYVEGAMPDGRVLAVVPNDYEVGRVKRDNPDLVVYSVSEVAKIIEAFRDEGKPSLVDSVKDVFEGAVVERVKTKTEMALNDEVPF